MTAENKTMLTIILDNHYEWCKKNGRDTTWMKTIGNLSWYKRFKNKKDYEQRLTINTDI
tara:strand:- start:3788 stop:3964 length:177 start_codon:yes stop_codon:yes gene_type:complete